MGQHFVLGGNNDDGDESFPPPKDPNSQLQHSKRNDANPEVNMNTQKSTPIPPSTFPVNRSGKTNIFYKTRLCLKFVIDGNCPNGDRCTFAHGSKDMREPPPNWQEYVTDNRGGNWNDDEKIIQRMRICKKFVNGEDCPYGDKCAFLHETPAKFRAGAALDSRRARETSVINIPTMADQTDQGGTGHPLKSSNEQTVQVKTVSNDPNVSMKDIYRKTRMCSRWETTGKCAYGDKCYFAHGLADLQTPVLQMEGDVHVHGIPAATCLLPNPTTEALTTSATTAVPTPRGQLRGFAKLANRKIKGIYGDWIDDEDNE